MRKSRKLSLLAGGVVVLVAGVWGFSSLNGAVPTIDPSKIATVERGTMTRSVVATGKVEPITKVEIKSKANGIIERLLVEVDQVVDSGRVLAELDKENLTARLREARANLQAAEAAREGAIAQLKKNEIEAEAPDVAFARRNNARADQLFEQKLVSQSALDDAKSALELAENRKRAAGGQLVISQAKVVEATANVAQARAAVERADEELANSTIKAPIRATVLTRDVEIGSPVSSILNLGANATLVMTLGDIESVFVRGKVDEADIGRVRLGQTAKITTESFPDKAFEGRVTQISQRHHVRSEGVDRQRGQGAQGQHDGQRRNRARAAPRFAAGAGGGSGVRCTEEVVRRRRGSRIENRPPACARAGGSRQRHEDADPRRREGWGQGGSSQLTRQR